MTSRNSKRSNVAQATSLLPHLDDAATETTLLQVKKAIENININVGDITLGDISVQSNDTTTHSKLDTLNTTIINKHLNSGLDSVEIGSIADGVVVPTTVENFPSSFAINNFPLVQDVSITNDITVSNSFALEDTLLTTNDKLDTINTTITDKHLNSILDSVNVNKTVEPIIYNLDYVGAQMYADSINGAIIDQYGRSGWFWTNNATTGGSNAYWYSNSIIPQNHMTKEQMDCVYVILALDRVEPNIVLPFIPMYSAPTGNNDHIPFFSHSVWTYTIPATHILNAGEVIMLTIGDHTKVDSIRPELRRVHLELNSTEGSGLPTESIAYISLNTDSGLKTLNGIQYLLQNAGFHYSVNDKIVEYEFNNGVKKVIEDNLTVDGVKVRGTIEVSSLPSIQITNTSFDVGNFPTSFEVSNFPTTTEISNTGFDVNNFPTSFEVSNFPTSTEISNTVAVYDANTEAINQKITNGTAPNNDCILVFQKNNPTSIEVSNFPSTYPVTGSFYQATQPISGSVSVSNFPSSQAVTGTFFQATQPISGSVSVSNSSLAVTGSFYQATQPISGSVSVSNLPSTQNVSITSGSVDINNFPVSQTVSGTVNIGNYPITQNVSVTSGSISVSNLPATQPVSGSVSVSNLPATQAISGSVSVSNLPATQPISGSISNSFTLDTTAQSTNTKLDTIHADLDGLTFDGSSNLNVNIANTSAVPVSGTFYPATQPVSGSVSVSNFPSSNNSHTQAYDPSGGGGYFDITSTTISASVSALDVAVKNTVPVSGTFYQATQPVSISGSVPVTGTFYQATQPVSIDNNLNVNINDFAGNSLTSDTFTFNGASKNGLDVAIINNSSNPVPVSGTFYPATQPVSGTVGISGTVPVSGTVGISGTVPVSGTFYQATQPVSGTIAITDSLGGNIISNANSLQTLITNTSIPVTGYVDAYLKDGAGNSINSTSSALNTFLTNTKTTNDYSQSGLNMYQIYPKIKSYGIGGFSNHNVADVMLAGQGNTLTVNSFVWGKINANKSYWLYTPTGANARTISYNYINSSGAEATATATGVVNSYVALQSNIVCLNNFTLNGGFSPSSTDGLYITLAGSGTTTTAVASIVGTRLNTNNAIFTVPNNCIAMVTNIDAILSTTNDSYYMNVWDENGNRTIPWTGYMYITGVNNYRAGSGDYGCIGRVLTAGETVAFTTSVSTTTNRYIFANIKVVYL